MGPVTINPLEIEIWRGDIVESKHAAHYCIVDNFGEIISRGGDPNLITYLRSASKPFQAMSVILAGAAEKFKITPKELALITGSHGGEKIHTELVISLLDRAGLSVDNLGCGTHPPFDKTTRTALYKSGGKPQLTHHNCSGKHAGMLLTALVDKVPLEEYLSPASRVQQRINNLICELTNLTPEELIVGIDGCSAPAHALSMKSAALAYARLINPTGMSTEIAEAANRVSRAMRSYPEMIGARQDRICTDLMRLGRVFELTAKSGAEGFYAAAWKDSTSGKGIGMSIKIEDGAERARNPLCIYLLQKHNIIPYELSQNLIKYAPGNILNGLKMVVGKIVIRDDN